MQGYYYQGTLLFKDTITQECCGLKAQLVTVNYCHLGYTYKETRAHHEKPPPSRVVNLYFPTESKSC